MEGGGWWGGGGERVAFDVILLGQNVSESFFVSRYMQIAFLVLMIYTH